MSEQLYTVTAFSNDYEHKPSRGVVYQVVDATEEYVEKLKAREAEEHPDRWLKVEAQG
ncbi:MULTISPECIES: hypothetical protein [Streptomyces]|uniref:Uncharacterized protein n=1 Tax=Streptomyces avermitilis TaxID=33903 RepID=A0A4D4MPL4_STRAX|nr:MULTISPECIES: hypothetical protein [Streptomyces]MYT01125.1 hypothetical protein [Streptomyces sp. SID5469]BBJ53704.1 hypothetical protein SAVMC3_63330 [Streptomyces avermitilis]GDY65708.1 hypothetical protein SAV14893_051010 [Streptomyces avermitilis]GDY74073.1 hypothetical protein SAV31267_035580 [Streptomyces avermitilis]GDY83142.1 hypothetical protein SAVCW2_23410 [Streptomyces avermitilis]